MPESPLLPLRRREVANLLPLSSDDALNHHLRDTLAALDNNRFLTEIHHNQLNFTAIIGIDGSRAVEKG